jgi:hypothetical protein
VTGSRLSKMKLCAFTIATGPAYRGLAQLTGQDDGQAMQGSSLPPHNEMPDNVPLAHRIPCSPESLGPHPEGLAEVRANRTHRRPTGLPPVLKFH